VGVAGVVVVGFVVVVGGGAGSSGGGIATGTTAFAAGVPPAVAKPTPKIADAHQAPRRPEARLMCA
jgi:hypothetical protein